MPFLLSRRLAAPLVFAAALASVAPAPAQADPLDDARVLADATFPGDPLAESGMREMLPVGFAAALAADGGLDVAARRLVAERAAAMFAARFRDRMVAAIARAMTGVYTAEELAAARAFAETPAGAGYFAKSAEASRVGAQVGGRTGEALQDAVFDDLAAAIRGGETLDAPRAQRAGIMAWAQRR